MNLIITNKEKIDLLESAFGKSKVANAGTNISVECPVCKKNSKNGTGKKKLSIDLSKGIYHCWVCESKGRSIGHFVKNNLNVSKSLLIKIFEIFDFKIEKEDLITTQIKLPSDFKLLSQTKDKSSKYAISYLENRGLTPDDFIKYKIGISKEKEYINRLIFPSFDENLNLNYFLSRTFDSSQKIKYKNCIEKRSNIIFNENLIDWSQKIVLVEGVFDAIKVSHNNVIPMLGSWIDQNHYLFRRIVIEGSEVVLGLDPDAYEKTLKIAENFASFGLKVSICNHQEKDFGDMTTDEVKYWIENAKIYEQTDRMTYLIQSITSGSIF